MRFDDSQCGVAQALEAMGDGWTGLIIRNAFFGAKRFGDFEKGLGIAKNVLSNRLQHLVEQEIFEKVDVGQTGERFEYHLTEKGEALFPILTALREWSDRWVFGEGHEPMIVRDRMSGKRVPTLEVRAADGRKLTRRDIRSEAGPGASASTQVLLRPRSKVQG